MTERCSDTVSQRSVGLRIAAEIVLASTGRAAVSGKQKAAERARSIVRTYVPHDMPRA